MKNRLTELFKKEPSKKVLSIFCTAGFPELNSIVPICESLEENGVDLIEIGMPFSDPVADGPVIQEASDVALKNGMTLEVLFRQLESLRERVSVPILLMGYINPVLQYGLERFVTSATSVGVDGVILPDLPLPEYRQQCKDLFANNNLSAVFLVTPHTPEDRIRELDSESSGFLYVVSTPSTTGSKLEVVAEQQEYFSRLRAMELKNPLLVGFGISDKESYERVCEHMDGAIIGSAFIRCIRESNDLSGDIQAFIKSIRS